MSKRKYYEGSKDILLVEENGTLYPFVLGDRKKRRIDGGHKDYSFAFQEESMDGYETTSWEEIKRVTDETFEELPA